MIRWVSKYVVSARVLFMNQGEGKMSWLSLYFAPILIAVSNPIY